jgi:hypothetical protein
MRTARDIARDMSGATTAAGETLRWQGAAERLYEGDLAFVNAGRPPLMHPWETNIGKPNRAGGAKFVTPRTDSSLLLQRGDDI